MGDLISWNDSKAKLRAATTHQGLINGPNTKRTIL